MRIAVIGANGKSGRFFVKAALLAGHQVTAGVRHTSKFGDQPNLKTVICDALVESDVQNLVKGQDAVVSLLGHKRGTQPNMQTHAMEILVASMKKQGVSRLVSLTGTGARQAGDKITLIDRLMNLSISLIDPSRVKDGINHIAVLEQSGLDWTVLRVLKLTNRLAGKFSLSEHGPAKTFVSRATVAEAILKLLEEKSFVRQSPILG